MINSLKYAKILEGSGFTREQAEAHIQVLLEVVEHDMATKQDLKEVDRGLKQELSSLAAGLRQEMNDLSVNLRQEMNGLSVNLRQEMKELRIETNNRFAQSEYKMTIRLGAIVTAVGGFMLTIMKLFIV